MKKNFLFVLMLLSISLAGWAQSALKNGASPSRWYGGAQGGISFGGSTFQSSGSDKNRVGFGFGLFGGYHLNPYLSAEGELRYSHLGLGMRRCEQHLWLGSDGLSYYAPVAGLNSWQYKELYSSTNMLGLAARLNVNVLYFWLPESRWSVLVSPELSALGSWANVNTISDQTTVHTSGGFHFGLGGQLGVGYELFEGMNLRVYSGLSYLTGKGMDGLPQTNHKHNYTWDSGIKVTYSLGKRKSRGTPKQSEFIPVSPQPAPAPAPVAEATAQPKPVSVPQPKQEPVEQPKPVQPQPKPVQPQPKTEAAVQPQPVPVPQPQPAAQSVTPPEPSVKPALKEKTVYKISIYFSIGKSNVIEPSQYGRTDLLLQALAKYPNSRIEITGRADTRGSVKRNREISLQRAETIKRYLVERKRISASRITTRSKGVDKATSAEQARRAEVRLIVTVK